jgi:hypothetical protein
MSMLSLQILTPGRVQIVTVLQLNLTHDYSLIRLLYRWINPRRRRAGYDY